MVHVFFHFLLLIILEHQSSYILHVVLNGTKTLDFLSDFTSILGILDSSLSTTLDIVKSLMYFVLIFLDSLIGRIFDGLYGFSFVSFNGTRTLIILYYFYSDSFKNVHAYCFFASLEGILVNL